MFNLPKATFDTKNQKINVHLANHFFSRLRGLLWSKPLDVAEALLIMPCNSIHTVGMHYAIDIVFLSSDYQILHIVPDCQPRRFISHKQAKHTLELLAGQAAAMGLKVGMQLTLSSKLENLKQLQI